MSCKVESIPLPPEHPHALSKYIWWIERRYVLTIICLLAAMINTSIIIVLIVNGHYNLYMYTYWNFMLITTLLYLIPLGIWLQGYIEATIALVFAPVMMGSAWLVVIIVAIVIILNPKNYIGNSVCDGGSLTFDKLRSFDWLLHGVPLVDLFILMLFDYKIYMRTLMFHLNRSRVWWKSVIYALYFFHAPLLPLAIYASIEDVSKRYKTPWNIGTWVAVTFALNYCVALQWYVALVVNISETRRMVPFYNLKPKSKRKIQLSMRHVDDLV